jgi:hypothetical protein
MDVDVVAGYAAGVRAQVINAGKVESRMRVGRIESGAEIVGVDAQVVGEGKRRR